MANLGRRIAGAEKNVASKEVSSNWDSTAPVVMNTASTFTRKIEWPVLSLLVKADNACYIDFSSDSIDIITTANAMDLDANEWYEVNVPWGEAVDMTKDEVYLQVQRINAATTTLKIVEG